MPSRTKLYNITFIYPFIVHVLYSRLRFRLFRSTEVKFCSVYQDHDTPVTYMMLSVQWLYCPFYAVIKHGAIVAMCVSIPVIFVASLIQGIHFECSPNLFISNSISEQTPLVLPKLHFRSLYSLFMALSHCPRLTAVSHRRRCRYFMKCNSFFILILPVFSVLCIILHNI